MRYPWDGTIISIIGTQIAPTCSCKDQIRYCKQNIHPGCSAHNNSEKNLGLLMMTSAYTYLVVRQVSTSFCSDITCCSVMAGGHFNPEGKLVCRKIIV